MREASDCPPCPVGIHGVEDVREGRFWSLVNVWSRMWISLYLLLMKEGGGRWVCLNVGLVHEVFLESWRMMSFEPNGFILRQRWYHLPGLHSPAVCQATLFRPTQYMCIIQATKHIQTYHPYTHNRPQLFHPHRRKQTRKKFYTCRKRDRMHI